MILLVRSATSSATAGSIVSPLVLGCEREIVVPFDPKTAKRENGAEKWDKAVGR